MPSKVKKPKGAVEILADNAKKAETLWMLQYARVCRAMNVLERRLGRNMTNEHPLVRLFNSMTLTYLTMQEWEHGESRESRGIRSTHYRGKALGLRPNGREACEIRLWSGTDEWPAHVRERLDTSGPPSRFYMAKEKANG